MFQAIQQLIRGLKGEETGPEFPADDPRLAAAAILVHIVAVDGVITDSERQTLRRVLASGYDLTEKETEELIQAARAKDEDAVDLYGFTSILKRTLDEEGRLRVVEMMWEMTYADGNLSEFEDNTVWRVAELLGISTRERISVKKRVQARLDSTADDATEI